MCRAVGAYFTSWALHADIPHSGTIDRDSNFFKDRLCFGAFAKRLGCKVYRRRKRHRYGRRATTTTSRPLAPNTSRDWTTRRIVHGRTSSPRALSAEDTPGHRPDDPGVAPDIFLLCTDQLSSEVSQRSVEQALLPDICSLAFDALFDTALNPQVR